MAATANGAVTAQSIEVVAMRVASPIAELMAITTSEVPIAWGIGILSTLRGMGAVRRQRLLGVADGV